MGKNGGALSRLVHTVCALNLSKMWGLRLFSGTSVPCDVTLPTQQYTCQDNNSIEVSILDCLKAVLETKRDY